MKKNIFMSIFYPIVFISFGLGVSMAQKFGDKLADGYWFMGLGFLILIISIFFINQEEKELEQ